MNKPLPVFNWSLKKALETEPDSFVKARIRIIFTILLFSLLKSGIVLLFGTMQGQWLQVARAAIAFVAYAVFLKVLLSRPGTLRPLAHILILTGILIIWTNIFVYSHKINLITIQFVFMVVLSSFYTLGNKMGFIYSAISMAPVILFLVTGGNVNIYFPNTTQELASPGFEIIVVLNFISITIAHYLFFDAFHVNIGEKEKLNRQLKVAIAEATELATSKSNFLSTMSHELRTPLNSVVGIAELLLEDNPEERQKENLKILHFSTLDLLALINNILDFNKIDSDKVTLEAVPFRLAEFVGNVCAGLSIKAGDKGLNFVLDIDRQIENMNVVSDPTRLAQLMYNLVSNAIKFTDNGSVTVKLECVRRGDHEAEVLFSVADTGIGIHPDRQQTVFEMFNQAESHITRKYGGTGLGLAIVKQVLGLFGSKIQLDSRPGEGSKFSFAITFETMADVAKPKTAQPAASADIGQLRILIAEDNDVNRLLMKKQLDRLGVDAIIVENGEQAYGACLTQNFDAIFMDLHMPVSDGYQTIRLIRAMEDPEKSGVYIVAFTASVTEQKKIAEAGFNDFLYKPVNMSDLKDKLEAIAQVRSEV